MRALRPVLARLRAVLALDEPPRRVAAALALGVFISVTPFWGFQTILALVTASIFRLNRAVTVAGTWLNLPWFAPFVYAGAVQLGALLVPDLSGAAGFWTWLLLGTTLLGIAAAVVTWVVTLGLMRTRSRRRPPDAGDSRRVA
ncbi:MAG TPA: DUF2062 domain-containing protein [Candidatus Tectomicrobia bacterium]|nr:DUF2062 domain-containing protein [Candidatus Tectomicrobia bacterium]